MTREATPVPLLDLRAQYATIRAEIEAAIAPVLESQRFVLGPEVEALEEEVAGYCGARFAVGCASGSDALLLALMALGVGPGDQVVCPTYTFFATGGAISRLGAEPVFADVDPASYNASAATLERAAARCARLRALLPVHLFGRAAELEGIEALAGRLGVPVIEDAAQAIGSLDGRGRRIGATGRVACFSFFPSKNLGGFGDGGLLTTGDEALARSLRMLRVHGGEPKYHHQVVGVNSRLDALQAAVLRVKLRHLEHWTEARRRNAAHYDELFGAAGAADSGVPLGQGGLPLRFPASPAEPARHVFNQYVIRVPGALRDRLRAFLAERRVGTEIYYPIPLHLQKCFRHLGYVEGELPEAEAAARETLALPIYAELSKEQVEHVADSVVDFLRREA
jgi:dTDP-4-amino-4,6-dideoxygalactose transaminase